MDRTVNKRPDKLTTPEMLGTTILELDAKKKAYVASGQGNKIVELTVTVDQLDLIVWGLLESQVKFNDVWTSPADKEKIKSLIKNLERQEFLQIEKSPPWVDHCHGIDSTT